MKNQKGIAPIVIIVLVVLVGGGTYAVVQRSILKSYFEKGDKPTEEQFADTIDSSLNLVDDADRADSKVQGVPATPSPISPSVTGQKVYNPTKEYVVGDTAVMSESIYQAKVLSGAEVAFTLDKAEPVTFRWTPLVPKPKEPVMYRIKVWQLMQGQNSTEAMRTNKPIVTKDVADITEATVSGIYTGPCKPPYLCEYVWAVETLSKDTPSAQTSAPIPAQESKTSISEEGGTASSVDTGSR